MVNRIKLKLYLTCIRAQKIGYNLRIIQRSIRTTIMNNPIRYPVKLNNLPEWAYLDAEWQLIKQQTVKMVDGDRYVLDNERYKREKANPTMSRLGLL